MQLDLLADLAADAEVLGLVLLPDADDGQNGEEDGDDDAHRSQGAEETGRGVAALIVFGEDRGKELHRTHAQQRADGVENGEQGALLGVVGQNGLAGTSLKK